MENISDTIDWLSERLKRYNYRFHVAGAYDNPDEKTLKVYFPFFCFLKIQFSKEKTAMRSRIFYGFGCSLELNFALYCALTTVLFVFFWDKLEPVVFMFPFLLLLHQIVCFVKLEALKIVIIQWLNQFESE